MTAKNLTIYGLLFAGVLACSTSAILIKSSTEPSILVAAFRLLIASILLSPFYLLALRKHRARYTRSHLRATIWPGVILGLHFITWITGVRYTLVANATLIVTMTPVVMPFFLYFLFRQKLTRAEWLGTLLAVVGVLVLTGFDFRFSPQHFRGDMICLLSLVLLTYYLVLARINRDIPSIWLYLAPLYFFAGVFCLLLTPLFQVNPFQVYPWREIVIFLGLALIPTVIGHSLFNYCMRHLPSQFVAIVTPGEFILAGILAYFFFREVPRWTFYAAGLLLLAGILAALKDQSRQFPSGDTEL
ncbi:MAG: DMT family transporter [Sedimentisphaerales bacterium]|nr:DMT family transporter [Sedimentisphaerales bacterium]